MKLCQQSKSSIELAIRNGINYFEHANGQTIVTDIHLQPNQNTGELYLFDDEDNDLAHTIINEWINFDGDNFYNDVEHELRSTLLKLQEEGIFDKLPILKPYSFVLVDEEKETISDLLLVDDDTMFIHDELLKGLDKELDTFLKDLLEK